VLGFAHGPMWWMDVADSWRSSSQRNLGIAHDAVAMGEQSVSVGFGIARMATNTGFRVASACIRGPAELIDQTVGPNAISSGLHGVGSVVTVAHRLTSAGQDLTESIAKSSLGATKAGLRAAGAREGEVLRLMIGEEAAEAVLAVEALVRSFAGPMSGLAMTDVISAARAWAVLQNAGSSLAQPGEEVALPDHCERWLRFTAAAFGAAWFAGLVDGFSPSAVARTRTARLRSGSEGDMALAAAGIEGRVEVLAFEQSTVGLFRPGYLAAVDYENDLVVISLRGTSSVSDALADLVCQPVPLTLGGLDGIAHEGMLRAAQRLESVLAALAEQGLDRLQANGRHAEQPQARVLICGHSLGAGVAALVAALWRDGGRLPGVDVRCLAFACPQILDVRLAAALSNHTTSIVVGDDMVPRLSLATATDLRSAMLLLAKPADFGADPSLHMQNVLASADRGEADRLVDAYVGIRHAACTSPNRMFPPGRLLHLVPGQPPRACCPSAFDELCISQDMAMAHLPRRYLVAIEEASLRRG